jgi:hypothetical protein
MPSRAGLIRSRPVQFGGYLVGVAIGERIFRPRATPPSFFGSLFNVAREEVVAVRWEVGRVNEDRLAGVTKRVLAGDRSVGVPPRPRLSVRRGSGFREPPSG